MARTTSEGPDGALERELGQLKGEYEKLREEQVRAEQTLAHLQAEMKALEEKALAEYGTSDPAELRAKLQTMRAENERLVSGYREHIASVRQGLKSLEQDSAEDAG
ncbi:MAG: hypothetical protein HY795_10405 [Desulfovibrio sp.]|nr:hypothetical protein [Desulfovibrio sp.]MBI4959712.1 hypothetical protein [Desulfovibrio sp.]